MNPRKSQVEHHREGTGRRERDQWRLGREFPIPLIVTLILQAAAIIWFFAGQAAELRTLGRQVVAMEAKIDSIATTVNSAAIPSATQTLKIEHLESRINELRTMANDNSRRITALEAANRR